MMSLGKTKLGELLIEQQEAVLQRWIDGTLATYPKDAAATFKRQKDPFANPIGHSLRVGTRGVFEAMLDGTDSEMLREGMHEIVKVRAVQQFAPSEAVGFVFQLKEIVRAELGKAARDASIAGELAEFDRQVDQLALVAFDVFVQCREQVSQLRINEVKRRVSWIAEKINRRDAEAAASDAPD